MRNFMSCLVRIIQIPLTESTKFLLFFGNYVNLGINIWILNVEWNHPWLSNTRITIQTVCFLYLSAARPIALLCQFQCSETTKYQLDFYCLLFMNEKGLARRRHDIYYSIYLRETRDASIQEAVTSCGYFIGFRWTDLPRSRECRCKCNDGFAPDFSKGCRLLFWSRRRARIWFHEDDSISGSLYWFPVP